MPTFEQYTELPLGEQQIFALWAIVHQPLSRIDLERWIERAALPRAPGAPRSHHEFKDLIRRWAAQEVVIATGTQHRTGPEFSPNRALSHEVAARLTPDELLRLVTFVRHERPFSMKFLYDADSLLGRELFLSLYTEPVAKLSESLAHYAAYRSEPAGMVLLKALGTEPPLARLNKLDPAHGLEYLRMALESCVEHARSLGEGPVSYLELARDRLGPALLLDGAFYLILRGDFAAAQRLLADETHVEAVSARCLLALAQGDFVTARQLAQRALETTRTKKTRQLKGLTNRLWPWLTLALLTSVEQPEHVALAREQLSIPEKKLAPWWSLRTLATLHAFFRGDKTRPAPVWPGRHQSWDEVWLNTLVARFTGATLDQESLTALTQRRKAAEQAGLVWLAQELSSLEGALQTQAQPARGLATLYVGEEPWERSLRALEGALVLAASATGAAPNNEERLVWSLLIAKDGSHELSARVQTRTKTGFSAGRQASWKKLHDAGTEAPYVAAHDRALIAQIKQTRDLHYTFTSDFALPPGAPLALVGHPLVFADSECQKHVEVVRREVRVDVRVHEGELRVDLLPSASVLHEVLCEREGGERIVVYALRPEQRLIAQQLSSTGLRLPSAARPRAQQVLGQLAAHFPLSSELPLETPNVDEVPADARLHFQLRRANPGLRVRWCVVPLGTGAQFAPGVGSANVLGTRVVDGAGSHNVRCTRDLEGERRELTRVLSACPTLAEIGPDSRELPLADLTSCLDLLCELRALGESIVVEWPDGQSLAVVAERELKDLKLALREQGSWFHVEGELPVDAARKLSFRALLELTAAQRGRFIPLGDGEFVALSESLRRALDSAAALSRTRGAELQLHPLAVLGITELSDVDLKTDKLVSERMSRAREAPLLTPEIPHTFEATLRPYQQQGYVFLSRLAHWGAGAVLADDMGLGKTLQTLALMVEHATRGPALVVAPTSVCTNWLDEARKFAPSLRVQRFGGGSREQQVRELGPLDVLVCSYGILQQEGALLASKRFQVIVLDEAQSIKNASTLRAKAALALIGNVRIALTGTPIENHLGELWSIVSFANPGLLGTPKSFDERFVKPIQRDGDRAATLLLRRLIKPFVLRRKKSEVLDDLPDKTIITLRVEPSDEERAFFAALREQALARVTDREKPAEARIRLLAELMRMRRAACHPALVAPDIGLVSSKLATLESLLQELIEGGHRVLVFSQFVDYLRLVRERLVALGISHQYLDGSSSARARADAVSAFQAGASDVFLISLKAGGFGLNLTAADYVVHLDPWWNPAVEDQASDRAHRIGQTRPVTIYRLVMEGSIEEKILQLHASKRELADDLLEGSGVGPALSVDELLALLGSVHADAAETRAVAATAE
jgi:superfamily II DNA or RNA helicase